MHFKRIHIELTNRCNFSCAFCPSSLMTRERGDMDFDLLCKALDEISREKLTDQVLFHLMGEPVLYPELVKAVKYAKDKKISVCLTTNGLAMDGRLLEQLLNVDIDHILFSVQTPEERSFKLRNAKVDFLQYKKHICRLIARAVENNGNTKITLSFLTTPLKSIILPSRKFSVVNTKKDLIDFFISWIEGILKVMSLESYVVKIQEHIMQIKEKLAEFRMLGWNRLNVTNNFILETRVLGDWVHPGLDADKIWKARVGYCEGGTEHFGVLWNGDMVFCCVDFDGNTKFANLKNCSIREAFQEEKVKASILGFKKFRVKHPYCQRCLGDGSLHKALARQIGSILYFKWYRNAWDKKRAKEEVLVQ